MFTQIVFWLLLLFEGYGEVTWHTLDLMYWNGHFFLTHSTQYPVQEITNLEATAGVKIRYTDHLADGPWWLQAVCTCPSKRLVRMENFLLDWFSGIKHNPKISSDRHRNFSSFSPTRKIRVMCTFLSSSLLVYISQLVSSFWLLSLTLWLTMWAAKLKKCWHINCQSHLSHDVDVCCTLLWN